MDQKKTDEWASKEVDICESFHLLDISESNAEATKLLEEKGIAETVFLLEGFNSHPDGSRESRYYSRELLQDPKTIAAFEGAVMLMGGNEHPDGKSELPKAVMKEVRFADGVGPEGEAGLAGRMRIHDPYTRQTLSNCQKLGTLREAFGLSIFGRANAPKRIVKGRTTYCVEAIAASPKPRVDFVTEPGAGGRVLLYESAHHGDGPETLTIAETREEKSRMDEQLKEALAKVSALEAESTKKDTAIAEANARIESLEADKKKAEHEARIAECKQVLADELGKADVPKATHEKLAESLKDCADPELIKITVAGEIKYLETLKESGSGIKHFGPRKTVDVSESNRPARTMEQRIADRKAEEMRRGVDESTATRIAESFYNGVAQ